jgi:hypothetical protein
VHHACVAGSQSVGQLGFIHRVPRLADARTGLCMESARVSSEVGVRIGLIRKQAQRHSGQAKFNKIVRILMDPALFGLFRGGRKGGHR